MSTATRGTVLSGRYRLEERLQSNADGALWRAVDSTLDRRVSIRVMRPAHPFAADVADAARRAALIDDDRLVRVLDVGSDGDTGFVVSEDVDGDSLAALVERSPLAPPVVRRIIGEVAQGLEAAAARGLHHLCLTPRSVIVCRDGTVKIVGTAVEAAAVGMEPAHAATASREDAVALVGLLYSGLTGRWPLGNTGFPPAPRGEGGGPVPPADLVRGIPNDLDTLCAVTLGGSDDGPRSPAELATQLAPWPSAEEAPLRAAPRRQPDDAPPAPLDADLPLKIRNRPAAKAGGASAAAGSPAVGPDAAATVSAEPAAAPGGIPRRSASMFPTSVADTGSLPIPKEPDTGGPRRMDSLFTPRSANPGNGTAQNAARGRADGLAPGSSDSPAPIWPADRTIPTPESGFATAGARTSADRAAPIAEPGSTHRTNKTGPAAELTANGGSPEEPMLPWSPSWSTGPVPTSGPETGPFPILIPAETPPREQSRLVIFSITVVLVLGLVVAAFSLRDLGSSGDAKPADTAAPRATVAPTGTAPTEVPSTAPIQPTTAAPTPSASAPVKIGSIRAIDPEGDGDENTRDSPLAVDGDQSTSWHSQTYHSSSFGGLKKGVGLSLKLKQSSTLTSATIDVGGTGGTVEVRTGNSPDVSSSKLFGRGTIENGQVTVEAKSAKPAKYVILWFTELPSVGGNYKVEVSEVRLK